MVFHVHVGALFSCWNSIDVHLFQKRQRKLYRVLVIAHDGHVIQQHIFIDIWAWLKVMFFCVLEQTISNGFHVSIALVVTADREDSGRASDGRGKFQFIDFCVKVGIKITFP